MTDISSQSVNWSSLAIQGRIRTRNRNQIWLQVVGLVSMSIAILMLFILVASLVVTGYKAFVQTHVTIDVFYDPALITADDPAKGNFRVVMQDTLRAAFPDVTERDQILDLTKMISNGAQFLVRDAVVADPGLIGKTVSITVPVSDPYDQLSKGFVNRAAVEGERRLSDVQIAAFDTLKAEGRISTPINWALITAADSRFPELAGLQGALVGSFYTLIICFGLAFPIGIGAALYLEEFAKRNRFSDFIEVNINNLAAVPSVVFGLLALAVFLGWFGLPRSSAFVGGLTLALMTLPTIIIATRAALKAVPPSIREAALGLGASRQQVVFQHVLPLAMPGIMTGTIIGLARALGEAAPLLLIGMNAFITSAPSSPFQPATALPTQILIWADSTERGFESRTSAAVLVLLVFLMTMNAVAIYVRSKFERRW